LREADKGEDGRQVSFSFGRKIDKMRACLAASEHLSKQASKNGACHNVIAARMEKTSYGQPFSALISGAKRVNRRKNDKSPRLHLPNQTALLSTSLGTLFNVQERVQNTISSQ